MAQSASFQRFYDNAAPMVPGALPSAMQAALFETLRDFMRATNIWQADIELNVSSDTNNYKFAIPATSDVIDVMPPVTATIEQGQSLSAAIDLGVGAQAARMTLPAAWTGNTVTFQVSTDGLTFYEMLDDVDQPVLANVGPDYSVALTPETWGGVRYLKVRSGMSGAPVAQAGNRSINFTVVSAVVPNYLTGARSSETATIAAGTALSPMVDLGDNFVAVRLAFPDSWDGNSVTFQASVDGTIFDELRDDIGVPVFINVTAGSRVTLPADVWRGVRYLKVRSGIPAAPTIQSADRAITITTATEYPPSDIAGVRQAVTATIPFGETLSDPIDLGLNYMGSRLVLPTGWAGHLVTFQVSIDGASFDEMRDDIGVPVQLVVGSDFSVALLAGFWKGTRYIKVRSGTLAAPVPQATDIDVTIVTVPLPAVVNSAAVNRLMNLYNSTDTTYRRWFWPAELRLPNTIVLLRPVSQSYTLIATLALFPVDPVDANGNPIFPSWILDNYFDVLFSGLLYRMLVQPAKPYSNAALAAVYYKVYLKGRGLAAADVVRSNVYNNQSWAFPAANVTYGRQRGV